MVSGKQGDGIAVIDKIIASRQMLEGKCTSEVYVYIPKPVAKMKKGDTFFLGCIDSPMRLRSTVTGTVWDSDRDGGIPVSYAGRPIGFLSGRDICEAIAYAMDLGIKVSVYATVTSAAGRRGYPIIRACTPPAAEIRTEALAKSKKLASIKKEKQKDSKETLAFAIGRGIAKAKSLLGNGR